MRITFEVWPEVHISKTQPQMHVRPAKAEDFVAITKIYRVAVLEGTGSFEIDPPDRQEMVERHQKVLSNGGFWFVAEDNPEDPLTVRGYAYAAPFHHRPAYRFALEVSVYVSTAHQGLGIGGLLLARIIETAGHRGFRHIIAVIGDSANEGSIGLHKSFGFEHAGTLKNIGFKHDKWLDVVYMQKTL